MNKVKTRGLGNYVFTACFWGSVYLWVVQDIVFFENLAVGIVSIIGAVSVICLSLTMHEEIYKKLIDEIKKDREGKINIYPKIIRDSSTAGMLVLFLGIGYHFVACLLMCHAVLILVIDKGLDDEGLDDEGLDDEGLDDEG